MRSNRVFGLDADEPERCAQTQLGVDGGPPALERAGFVRPRLARGEGDQRRKDDPEPHQNAWPTAKPV